MQVETSRSCGVNRRKFLNYIQTNSIAVCLASLPYVANALPVNLLDAQMAGQASPGNRVDTGKASNAPGLHGLDFKQSNLFRAWFAKMVHAQLQSGPNPRWVHRDCAGLVRFAVDESLREHDDKWKKNNGFQNQKLPPELILSQEQKKIRQRWRLADGRQSAYVNALELIQENARFLGRYMSVANVADLLFFDFGDQQHLMIMMGTYIAYHTGQIRERDNGLRAVTFDRLANWQDSRWRPVPSNPNFRGLFRLGFLV